MKFYEVKELVKPMTFEIGSARASQVFKDMQEYARNHPDEEIVGFVTRRKEK